MSARIEPKLVVNDLRSSARLPYAPAQALPPGVGSPYGPEMSFGSVAFAQRDADDLTPPSLSIAADPIPGWRIAGSLASAQRFLLRVPDAWNGRLVVAGCPGQRSEFACDRLFGDWLLARGYAYVASNKGQGDGAVLCAPNATFAIDGITLPRFTLPNGMALSFWQHAPGHTIERWRDDLIAIAEFAIERIAKECARAPEAVYAIGLSNGGYTVRRAIETSDLFAGALTWNAVMWTPTHNLLSYLPMAIEALLSGTPEDLVPLGIPPDVIGLSGTSLYARNLASYYLVTAWLHAMHLDPSTSLAYGDTRDPRAAEAWQSRIGSWRLDRAPLIAERIAGFANTGEIACKLVEIAAEYDHLIPPAVHDAPYRDLAAAAGRSALRRGRIVPGAQHVDRWSDAPDFPQMRVAYREVWRGFEELTRWVEGEPDP